MIIRGVLAHFSVAAVVCEPRYLTRLLPHDVPLWVFEHQLCPYFDSTKRTERLPPQRHIRIFICGVVDVVDDVPVLLGADDLVCPAIAVCVPEVLTMLLNPRTSIIIAGINVTSR